MNYYILQKSIDNTIELHINCPHMRRIFWAFPLYTSEINAFKESGVNIILREPLINNLQNVSIVCPNKEVVNKAVELLDSLITSWTLGGENRFV